jgi:hypothetical protein
MDSKYTFKDLSHGFVRCDQTGTVYRLRADGNFDSWENTPADVKVSQLEGVDYVRNSTQRVVERCLAEKLALKLMGKDSFDGKRDAITI